MKKDMKFLLCVVLVAVLLNLVNTLLAKQFATPRQKAGPVNKLNVWDQGVYSAVVGANSPVASSLSVLVLVAVSVLVARALC